MRALAKGVELDPAEIEAETGVPLATWQELMDRMKQAKYGVILFGMGLTMTRGKHLNSYALLSLGPRHERPHAVRLQADARPRQRHRRRQRGDVADRLSLRGQPGARLSSVQPGRVHDRRYARPRRGRRGADHRQRPDVQLLQAAREHLARIPSIVLDPKDTPTTRAATVVFHTATYGINTAGTVYRMDDVPIPLRPAFESNLPER